MAVTYFEISYPNFVLGAIIDPEEANQNNHDIVTKVNTMITAINTNETKITNLTTSKADVVYVDNKINNLAGSGRTTETVRQNFVNLANHKISSDHDSRYYTKSLLDGGQLNHLYYTKTELTPWLRGGDTNIKEEVFKIVSSNNGDGTFTYSDGNKNIIGALTSEGYQIFTLTKGNYVLGSNRVEIIVNDTLRRSVASGGLVEISTTEVALSSPEGAGAEITIKYYERIGVSAEYNIKLSKTKPPSNDGKTMWFELIE